MTETIRPLLDAAIAGAPFGKRLGFVLEDFDASHATLRLPYDAQNVTFGDTVHGGAIASLIDVAAVAAAWAGHDDFTGLKGATLGLSLSYLAPARGCDLVATATVRRRGRAIVFLEVVVCSDPEDAVVATAQVTYHLTKKESPAEVMASLFAGKDADAQRALLATLERGGAAIYDGLAAAAKDDAERAALEEAAARERANAELLEG